MGSAEVVYREIGRPESFADPALARQLLAALQLGGWKWHVILAATGRNDDYILIAQVTIFFQDAQWRNQPRTYLLNQSIVRCQAKSAAALLYRSGVASQLKPCTAPG